MIIGYQGEIGCYSYNSIKNNLNNYNSLKKYNTFREIFIDLHKSKNITHAYIPIENTIGGKLYENEKMINEFNFIITNIYKYKISHCLLSQKNVKKNDIKHVKSHWQALSQCSDYLNKNNFNTQEYYDTAGACKFIYENKIKDTAAIASSECSNIYNLEIIDDNIQNNENNYTIFYLIKNNNLS